MSKTNYIIKCKNKDYLLALYTDGTLVLYRIEDNKVRYIILQTFDNTIEDYYCLKRVFKLSGLLDTKSLF